MDWGKITFVLAYFLLERLLDRLERVAGLPFSTVCVSPLRVLRLMDPILHCTMFVNPGYSPFGE